MNAKEMETRLKALEKKVGILDDIDEVKRLQRVYSYYVMHMMRDEIYDCFADRADVSLHWLEGTGRARKASNGISAWARTGRNRRPAFYIRSCPSPG